MGKSYLFSIITPNINSKTIHYVMVRIQGKEAIIPHFALTERAKARITMPTRTVLLLINKNVLNKTR